VISKKKKEIKILLLLLLLLLLFKKNSNLGPFGFGFFHKLQKFPSSIEIGCTFVLKKHERKKFLHISIERECCASTCGPPSYVGQFLLISIEAHVRKLI